MISDGYSRHDKSPGSYKGMLPDRNRSGNQRLGFMIHIMSSSAEVSLLSDDAVFSEVDESQRIQVCAVANAGPMVEPKMPGDLDTGTIVNKGLSMDFSPEKPKDEEPPLVGGFGSPLTKASPCKMP